MLGKHFILLIKNVIISFLTNDFLFFIMCCSITFITYKNSWLFTFYFDLEVLVRQYGKILLLPYFLTFCNLESFQIIYFLNNLFMTYWIVLWKLILAFNKCSFLTFKFKQSLNVFNNFIADKNLFQPKVLYLRNS